MYTRAPILGAIQGGHQQWLLASIVVLVLLFPLVPLVFLPRGKLFEAALRESIAQGNITPVLRKHMADPVVKWAHGAEMMGIAVIVVLMVLKPF